MALIFPDIDPVIFHLGSTPFKVTWYSLSYVASILIAWKYIQYLNKVTNSTIKEKFIDDLVTYIILGIVVGGRLGYVLFYDLEKNLANPLNIIRTWEGGMSFHGGLLGVIITSFIYCKMHKVSFLKIADFICCAAPIGLFFGRIANFINAELYGRYTEVPWGVIFPGQNHPRHPSQLYESFSEGLLIFTILFVLYRYTKIKNYSGMISGLFLLLYALFRGIIENYRQPDEHLGFIISNYTMGQLLSLPMVISGFILIFYSAIKK